MGIWVGAFIQESVADFSGKVDAVHHKPITDIIISFILSSTLNSTKMRDLFGGSTKFSRCLVSQSDRYRHSPKTLPKIPRTTESSFLPGRFSFVSSSLWTLSSNVLKLYQYWPKSNFFMDGHYHWKCHLAIPRAFPELPFFLRYEDACLIDIGDTVLKHG